jgi:hypothetical protein
MQTPMEVPVSVVSPFSHQDQYLAHRTTNVNPEFTSILRPLYEFYIFGVVDQDHMI